MVQFVHQLQFNRKTLLQKSQNSLTRISGVNLLTVTCLFLTSGCADVPPSRSSANPQIFSHPQRTEEDMANAMEAEAFTPPERVSADQIQLEAFRRDEFRLETPAHTIGTQATDNSP